MVERIEYHDIVDKTGWGAGPWQREPDKLQWQDDSTGLPCLIVRNNLGALCGYVGVLPTHPFYKIDYSTCPKACGESYCEHTPSSYLNVHGGITFADGCMSHTREDWEKFRETLKGRQPEALAYPLGDAAEAIKEWSPFLDDYEGWLKRKQARSICHVPSPGEPDCVWWFGFDCAHYMDIAPKMRQYNLRSMSGDMGEVYRDIDYMQTECRELAKQLADYATANATSVAQSIAKG